VRLSLRALDAACELVHVVKVVLPICYSWFQPVESYGQLIGIKIGECLACQVACIASQ
jgi:hypothetical protein